MPLHIEPYAPAELIGALFARPRRNPDLQWEVAHVISPPGTPYTVAMLTNRAPAPQQCSDKQNDFGYYFVRRINAHGVLFSACPRDELDAVLERYRRDEPCKDGARWAEDVPLSGVSEFAAQPVFAQVGGGQKRSRKTPVALLPGVQPELFEMVPSDGATRSVSFWQQVDRDVMHTMNAWLVHYALPFYAGVDEVPDAAVQYVFARLATPAGVTDEAAQRRCAEFAAACRARYDELRAHVAATPALQVAPFATRLHAAFAPSKQAFVADLRLDAAADANNWRATVAQRFVEKVLVQCGGVDSELGIVSGYLECARSDADQHYFPKTRDAARRRAAGAALRVDRADGEKLITPPAERLFHVQMVGDRQALLTGMRCNAVCFLLAGPQPGYSTGTGRFYPKNQVVGARLNERPDSASLFAHAGGESDDDMLFEGVTADDLARAGHVAVKRKRESDDDDYAAEAPEHLAPEHMRAEDARARG